MRAHLNKPLCLGGEQLECANKVVSFAEGDNLLKLRFLLFN